MKTNKIIALTSLVLYVPFCAVVYPRIARGGDSGTNYFVPGGLDVINNDPQYNNVISGSYSAIIGGKNLTSKGEREVMVGELCWTNLTSHVTLPQPVWEVATNWTEILGSQTDNGVISGPGWISYGGSIKYEIVGEKGQIVSNLVLSVIYKGVNQRITLETQNGPVLGRSFESFELIHNEDGSTTTNRIPSRKIKTIEGFRGL